MSTTYQPFPPPADRDIIAPLKLIDGLAVWTEYDGKAVQVSGNAQYDTIAIKQVNANTLIDERKKTGGPYKANVRTVVSNGGKTMTTTTKGTNADGKEFTQILIYEKQ